MRIGFLRRSPACLAVLLLLSSFALGLDVEDGEWGYYSRVLDGTRYSPLEQITRGNVRNLERAWVYRTGDIAEGNAHYFECTPLMIDNTLYIITTFSRLIALDAVTGEEKWGFQPEPPLAHRETGAGGLASRGVSYWKSGDKERIFLPVRDGRLYSIDIKTHQPDPEFGKDGFINLRKGLEREGRFLFISSPPAIYEDLVIQGFGINDAAEKLPHVPLRAFNAHTGEVVWSFNTIPQEGEPGTETWENESWRNRGGGNVWSIMTVDRERGMLFLPVSTPNYDFFASDRPGRNLYTDCVVALDAKTGKHLWHFQAVHHDLWDYDMAAQPNLVELTIDGEEVPAVTCVGKTGFAYVLHRETGKPLFPVEERPVPQSDIPGEQVYPTQPFPLKPPALVRQKLTLDDLSDLDEETHDFVVKRFRELRSEGIFTPPSPEGTIVFPGLHGGGNWSGAAVSPDGMMYVNTTEVPFIIGLEKRDEGPFDYRVYGGIYFRDQNGYPAVKPPWGQLVKVDLNQGEILWEKPLGEFEELARKGIPPTGQENFGGATITKSGLVLIASSMDGKIRAFDSDTGGILWCDQMEAAGYAAPITYLGKDGKQYIVICAGGGAKPGTKHGDYVIGYRLKE
ncbi:MAG: pyrroloquinoline quinone-dependent dehydrogenase [bacterium]|jgi:quinoprotein glucose dehydrogenase